MNLKDRDDGSADIVRLRGHCIVKGDGKLSALDVQNLGTIKIRGEVFSCQSGGHDNDSQFAQLVLPSCGLCHLDNAKEEVGVNCPLVSFV